MYNSAPGPIIATVAEMEEKNNQDEREGDILKSVTVPEEAHDPTSYTGAKANDDIALVGRCSTSYNKSKRTNAGARIT